MPVSDSTQVTQRDIDELLSDLPPESLAVLKQFVEFLRQQRSAANRWSPPTRSLISSLSTIAPRLPA